MIKPFNFSHLSDRSRAKWEVSNFGGLDYAQDSTQIADNRSPDLLNLLLDRRGGIAKRPGWKTILPLNRQNAISFLGYYNKEDLFIFGYEEGIFTWHSNNQEWPELIFTCDDLDHKSKRTFFEMNDKFYIVGGGYFLAYDGDEVEDLVEDAYIPTLNKEVSKSNPHGMEYEQPNILSSYYKIRRHVGTTSTTKLPYPNTMTYSISVISGSQVYESRLDRKDNSIYVKLSTSDVDPHTILEFTIRQNNNWDYKDIAYCNIAKLFGGANDTRVFLSGNSDYANRDWYCDLYNPKYFPLNYYTDIGSTYEPITGYSIQYDTLVVHKKNSTWLREYENHGVTESLTASFPLRPVNDQVGFIAPESISLLNNNPTGLTYNGIYQLTSSSVRNERNMQHISTRVDRRLLNEKDLTKAKSFNWNNYYGLFFDDRVYLYDYLLDEWLFWDSIPATCFCVHDNMLYFGTNNGNIAVFTNQKDALYNQDDGQPINAYWTSKDTDLGYGEYLKTIEKFYLQMRPYNQIDNSNNNNNNNNSNSTISASFYSNRHEETKIADFDTAQIKTKQNGLPVAFSKKCRWKRIMHLRVKIANNNVDQDLSFCNIGVIWQATKTN